MEYRREHLGFGTGQHDSFTRCVLCLTFSKPILIPHTSYSPHKIIFGHETVKGVAEEVGLLGGTKVFIVTDQPERFNETRCAFNLSKSDLNRFTKQNVLLNPFQDSLFGDSELAHSDKAVP